MIKKLFTLVLLMGAALTSWGTVTSSWDAATKTLTVQYTADGTELNLGNICSENGCAGQVETLVISGDFTNYQWSQKVNGFISTCASSNGIYVDMAGCTSLVCNLVSYSYEGNQPTFVYGPEEVAGSQVQVDKQNTVTVINNKAEVTSNTVYGLWSTGDCDPSTGLKPASVPDDAYFEEKEDGWHLIIPSWGNQDNKLSVNTITTYTYENEVPETVVADNTNDLTQVDGDWYYIRYIYDDQYGNHKVEATTNGLTQIDGTWYYVYQETVSIDPVSKFGGFTNLDNKITGVTFPNSAQFTYIPDEMFLKSNGTLTTVVLSDYIEAIGNSAFQGCTLLQDVIFPKSLKVIGAKAFQKCQSLTKVDLNLPALEGVFRNAFDMNDDQNNPVNKLATIILPQNNTTLTQWGNNVFCMAVAKKLDFSGCKGITNFLDEDDNATFNWHCFMEEIILPPNLARLGKSAFKDCTMLKKATFTGQAKYENGAFVNPLIIGEKAFEDCKALTTVIFSNNLQTIKTDAFTRSGIKEADLHECHELTLIENKAFENCASLTDVILCSHPKVIKGGRGSGAFYNSKAITRVEVMGCENTCVTECVCESGAFDLDVTNVQTQIESVESAARLIFPRDLPVCEGSEYTSSYDFFVGDYKDGIACENHDQLQDYWYDVPWSETGVVTSVKDGHELGGARYANNGWLEFINTGDGVVIKPENGEFLRTYSRTEGSGPVLLPEGIIAYRAIDYASIDEDYVEDPDGEYVLVNPTETDQEKLIYKEESKLTDEEKATADLNTHYGFLTVKGQLLLRPLMTAHQDHIGDPEWTRSYVPENTGVVLYSYGINEDVFLMFDAYVKDDHEFKQYPFTGTRYEKKRLDEGGTVGGDDDDINMLVGSYGSDCPVAPVYPWVYKDKENYKGGSYTSKKEYRQFGFNKSKNKWLRLQPGLLKLNRAYAKIPIFRFDNLNESDSQMPDFTREDHVDEVEGNSNLMLVFDNSFEGQGQETDDIRTINNSVQPTDANVWYTLQGVKVTKPVKGGVYIHNNKKVVIK